MAKGTSNKVVKRVESIEGMNIRDAAELRYITEQRTMRWLCRRWGLNIRTVMRILRSYGIPIRHGSDSIRTQWIDAEERRVAAGERLAATNHRLAQEGKHVRQGKNKQNSELVRQVADKLKSSSSFLRPDVRAKSISGSLATRREHPERMSSLRNPLSKAEEIMKCHVSAMSLEMEVRKLFGTYVADFFLPSIRLVIDCQGRNRFPLSPKRHKCFLQEGVRIAYCLNEYVFRGDFTQLDDYISRVKAACADPSSVCEESVIFGACGRAPFGDDAAEFIVHRSGVRTRYLTEVSTASDYDVSSSD